MHKYIRVTHSLMHCQINNISGMITQSSFKCNALSNWCAYQFFAYIIYAAAMNAVISKAMQQQLSIYSFLETRVY